MALISISKVNDLMIYFKWDDRMRHYREYKFNPKIKPIYATINELGIGDYLVSKEFKLWLKKYDLDNLWSKCETIRKCYDNDVAFMGFDIIYIQNAEETFHILLNEIYNMDKNGFFKFISFIMVEFCQWRNNREFSKIPDKKLTKLEKYLYPIVDEDDGEYIKIIDEIFEEISKHNKNPRCKTKLKIYVKNFKQYIDEHINQHIKFMGYEGKLSGVIIIIIGGIVGLGVLATFLNYTGILKFDDFISIMLKLITNYLG